MIINWHQTIFNHSLWRQSFMNSKMDHFVPSIVSIPFCRVNFTLQLILQILLESLTLSRNKEWQKWEKIPPNTDNFQRQVSHSRVATKIFEDLGGALCKAFIIGWEPVSSVHYIKPGTCINRQLHQALIQYQAAHPKLIHYITPCKLG